MAATASLTPAADHIQVTYSDAAGYRVARSFTDDTDYADDLTDSIADATESTFYDRSVVQAHTYHYWMHEMSGDTYESIGSSRMFQPKAYGRRGGKKGRSLDYNVECPLCGFLCRRNLLRRGYVKPHVTGENYLPLAAAPESWTYTVNDPSYYDINSYFQVNDIEATVVFPQYEKPLGYWYPGVPLIGSSSLIELGSPASKDALYPIVHLYARVATQIQCGVYQVGSDRQLWLNLPLEPGWHKLIGDLNAYTADPVGILISPQTSSLPIGFGGAQLVMTNPEMAILPHRSTGIGQYTTGGMMPLCPDCYSGLRRRVPWE